MMNNINIYFFKHPLGYNTVPGDRHIKRFIKRRLNIESITGAEKVFVNLCKGFDQLNIKYTKNTPFNKIMPNEPVVVLGDDFYNSKQFLKGYNKPNRLIAGIGLMTHPSEWPNLLQQYTVAKYLQHCSWANELFEPYYGKDVCEEWPAGIDTDKWSPNKKVKKKYDILLYNKIRWDKAERTNTLRNPIIKKLNELGLSYKEVVYGEYKEKNYYKLVQQCGAMIFICEHETQGFALCEALSANLPVFAWDPGNCLDPARFKWNAPDIKTTSIPFFDSSCGMSFCDTDDFFSKINAFWEGVTKKAFNPREYIVKNLSLTLSAQKMLAIIEKLSVLTAHRENEELLRKIVRSEDKRSPAKTEELKEIVELAINNNPGFLTKFNEFDTEFSKNLLAIAPNMVATEIEFCALLKLNFDTKEIARYTKSSVRAVEGRKYRIRKKLGIPSDQDINVWMTHI